MNKNEIIEKIANFISQNYKAYKLPAFCVKLGLKDGDIAEPYLSKIKYVRIRIENFDENQLLQLIKKIEVETGVDLLK